MPLSGMSVEPRRAESLIDGEVALIEYGVGARLSMGAS